jgi:hypothetical protein
MRTVCICSKTCGTSEKHKQNIFFAERHEKWFENTSLKVRKVQWESCKIKQGRRRPRRYLTSMSRRWDRK